MRANRIFQVIAIFALLLIADKILADEVFLKNGDHITGKVITMENKILIFKTSYAGEISIKWVDLTGIQTDEPIHMILCNKTSTLGIAIPAREGGMQGKSDKTAQYNYDGILNLPLERKK